MKLPWMKLFTRDWLDSKELRRCSGMSRAILMDLMCLAHEGERYGYLEDAIGPLTDEFMAARCTVSVPELLKAISELTKNQRLKREGDSLFVSRMVSDEEVRVKRAAGGILGGNPKLKNRQPSNLEVNLPSSLEVNLPSNLEVNLPSNLEVNLPSHQNQQPPDESTICKIEGYPSGYPYVASASRARASADSDSDSSLHKKQIVSVASNGQFEEIMAAFDRHEKFSNWEAKESVVQLVSGMNGQFDWEKFRANHEKYCSYWAENGWKYCTLTFLGWIRVGMPPPPPKATNGNGHSADTPKLTICPRCSQKPCVCFDRQLAKERAAGA